MSPANTVTTAPSGHVLPRWAYLALALACVAMGLWASYITLEYFEHGAKALETDKALQGLAVAASVMFVASEMGAFTMAALLTERQLKARRWLLTGFAVAVLALEVWTIVAVNMALTSGADLTQTTVQTQEKDLRARIALIEADAAAKRATADQQRATAKTAYELHLAGKSSDKAAAEQAKTTALYDELKTVQTQKRPTLTGLMGEKTALFYAVVRGVLVSLAGLVFFGTAGALLRAARGGAQSVDHQLLALLHELRGTPIHAVLQAQAVAPAAPAELASLRNSASSAAPSPAQAPALAAPATPAQIAAPAVPAPAVAPAPDTPAAAPAPFSFTGFMKAPATPLSGKAMLAGAGALAALTAPMAHSAPAVPAAGAVKPAHPIAPAALAEPVNVDTPRPVNVDTPAPANGGTSAAPDVSVFPSAKPVNVDTPDPVNVDTPAPMKTGLFSPADGDVLTGAEPVNVDTPEPVNVDTPEAPKKARKARVVRDGAVMDSGLSEHDGARYRRALAGVKSGKIRPSLAGLSEAVGVEASAPVARRYLAAMADAGVIAPSGRGFALVKKGGAA